MFRSGLQFWHIVVLLVVVLLLFGANRLPDLARSLGKSMKILKEEVTDLRGDETPPADAAPRNDESARNGSTRPGDQAHEPPPSEPGPAGR